MLGEEILESVNELLGQVTQDPVDPAVNSSANRRNAKRHHEATKIVLSPASSSMRTQEHIPAVCRNYTQSGCGISSQFAPRVGDVYRIEVPESTRHPLHSSFARCVRCTLIDEDLFEAGLCFLSRIANESSSESDDFTASDLL